MSYYEIYFAIAIMSVVNIFTRAFPFLFFRNSEPPKIIMYIEKYFPAVIMTILILYSLKDINFHQTPYGLKEISGVIFTGCIHLLIKNYLVSIFGGTIFYMFLVQYF